ncbi:MAG: hypothetical protein DMG05_19270 [Acidobacteria bacterium]|nr:MAG: hypothetical protein DMG05_19270 [Acidobacteriota bacterium]
MNDPSEPLPPGKLEISKLVILNKREAKDAPSEKLPCWITFFDPEKDPWVRKTYGMTGLRRHKLLRITGEVYEQSISLNQEVVSSDLLGCGIRTLQRDIILFASLGVWIPFQHVSNPNRAGGYTYKVAVVKLYLEGMTKAEITSSLYHDPERIGKFIEDFARFTKLAQSGLSIYQIKAVLLLPEVLLEEYWTLFKIYNTPQLFKKLDLLAKAVR